MSANYQSKLYHKIILLKPANNQLLRYFVLIIIHFTVFSAHKPRDHYMIAPEVTSLTYFHFIHDHIPDGVLLVFFVSFVFFFFFHGGSVTYTLDTLTHALTHRWDVCRRPQTPHQGALKRSATWPEQGDARQRGSAAAQRCNILLQDYRLGCWELAAVKLLLTHLTLASPLPEAPPSKKKTGRERKLTKCQHRVGGLTSSILLLPLLLSNDAPLKCQAN